MSPPKGKNPNPTPPVNPDNLLFRQLCRKGDIVQMKNKLKEGVADYTEPGATVRKWTPLHIICWGTAKPAQDAQMAEAILMQAQKEGKDQDVRNAKDAMDGKTPLDLAKERRDMCAGAGAGGEEKEGVDEKKKYEKIIDMLEKGVSAS